MNRRILLLNSLMFLLASFNIMARNCNDLFLKQYIVTNDTVVIKKLGHSFLKYHIQRDSVYTLEWGNELVENTSKDTFEVLGSGVLGIIDNDEQTIILGQSCGTSCSRYVILSLQFNSKEKEYLFAKAYDLANHLVAFIPEDNNIFVRIENFMTGQYMNIIESDLCPATIKGDCIDDIYFSKDSIIIKWQGKEWSNNKTDPKEIKLKIELR